MLTTARLCQYLCHRIHAPIRVYNAGGSLTETYIDYGEQQDVLSCDPAFAHKLLSVRNPDCPRFFLEVNEIIYGIIANEDFTYIIGPCALSDEKAKLSRYLIREHGMDPGLPYRLYQMPLHDFVDPMAAIFESISDKEANKDDILAESIMSDEFKRSMQKHVHDVLYDRRENQAVHNPYQQEEQEQNAIRKGDVEELKRSFNQIYVGQLGTLSHNSLRQAKYLAITVITLASRSAIAGGLLPEVSYSMSDAFVQQIDVMSDESKIYALLRQAEIKYCNAVHNLSQNTTRNRLVIRCKELISCRLHSKIEVQELAAELEVSSAYLSNLFSTEEGITLSDYIVRQKIESSKERLNFSDDPITDIAATYGFSSQSHFGRIFKRLTGMTPGEYRRKSS